VKAKPHEDTPKFEYYFDGWTTDCGTSLTKDCTFTGTFNRTAKTYTVTYAFNKNPY